MLKGCKAHRGDAAAMRKKPRRGNSHADEASAHACVLPVGDDAWPANVYLFTLSQKKGNSLCVRWAAAAREVRAHAIRTLTLAGLVRKFCAKKAERNKTKLKKIT